MTIRACAVDDVPLGEGRRLTVDGRRIAIFRTTTGWYALDDTCPHRGGPLSDGLLADCSVTCPLHERRYDLRTGQGPAGAAPVGVHGVSVRDGEVWLTAR